jgi:hypothetical protein
MDFDLMARLYEYQAIAIDPEEKVETREHYRNRLVMVRDELNAMLEEIARC